MLVVVFKNSETVKPNTPDTKLTQNRKRDGQKFR